MKSKNLNKSTISSSNNSSSTISASLSSKQTAKALQCSFSLNRDINNSLVNTPSPLNSCVNNINNNTHNHISNSTHKSSMKYSKPSQSSKEFIPTYNQNDQYNQSDNNNTTKTTLTIHPSEKESRLHPAVPVVTMEKSSNSKSNKSNSKNTSTILIASNGHNVIRTKKQSNLTSSLRPLLITLIISMSVLTTLLSTGTININKDNFLATRSKYLYDSISGFRNDAQNTEHSSRYIRSTNNQDSLGDQIKALSDNEGIYSASTKRLFKFLVSTIQLLRLDNIAALANIDALKAASANVKGGKLRYIPGSARDPSNTAHHMLEAPGYRLNIPSYVQQIPQQNSKSDLTDRLKQTQLKQKNLKDQASGIVETPVAAGQNMINDHFVTSQNQEVNEQLAQNNQNLNNVANQFASLQADGAFFGLENDMNDIGIDKYNDIIRQNYYGTGKKAFSESGLVKEAIANPNDVPLETVDPSLSNIISNLLTEQNTEEKRYDQHGVLINHPRSIFGNNDTSSGLKTCKPEENIVFAKTHKTGGTTITNMLLRHAEKQQLNVGLPVEYHWELAGYPANFDSRLITPKADNYNILCHHMRFDKKKIEQIVDPNSKYFTILRDPVTNFESSFGFFKDYPFTEWQGEDRSLDQFLDNPEKYYNKSTPWYFRAKNYMSFDLGLDHENDSDEYIIEAIKSLQNNFQFIMMTDRYEESVIMLKEMLCLDFDDVVYLPLKVRTDNDRQKVSSETAAKIKKWNRLDTAIYEYFSKRFEQLTVDFGKERMKEQVGILREKLKDLETRCVEDYDSQSLKPWIKRIKLRKPSGEKCQRLVWGEVKYADYLRELELSRLSESDKKSQPSFDSRIELMEDVQSTILGNPTS